VQWTLKHFGALFSRHRQQTRHAANFVTFLDVQKLKAFSFMWALPLSPRPGPLHLDPTGGLGPHSPYKLAVPHSPCAPTLVYKCLHQLVAPYLVSMISPVSAVSTRRHLRSAGQGYLVVPRTRTTGFGPRSFSVAGPLAWNSLPPKIKTTSLTLGQFSGRLKTEVLLCSYYASAQPSKLLF